MEAEFTRWLREHVPAYTNWPLALGDDAALWTRGADTGNIVVTTDLVSDGVDFRLDEVDPRGVGRKALAVNLSDLAAMAAAPRAAVITIALPRSGANSRTPLELAIALYEGLLPLAAEFGVAIAGGDTNTHHGPLVISITAIGEVASRGPLTRSGGQPGDALLVTGKLGGSAAGHHFDFTPRVREALLLNERYDLRAGMDISDGLALDVSRLAAASGCGAVIHVDNVPISAAVRTCENPLDHALGDGEDFELLVVAPPRVAERILTDQPLACGVTSIGEFVAEHGLWQQSDDGFRSPLAPTGWQH